MSGGRNGAARPSRARRVARVARVVGGYVAGIAAGSLATGAGILAQDVVMTGEIPTAYVWVLLAILTAGLFVAGLPVGLLPALTVVLVGRWTGMSGVGFFAVAGALTSFAVLSAFLSAAILAGGDTFSVDLPGSARAGFGVATMLYGAVAGTIYARTARPSRP